MCRLIQVQVVVLQVYSRNHIIFNMFFWGCVFVPWKTKCPRSTFKIMQNPLLCCLCHILAISSSLRNRQKKIWDLPSGCHEPRHHERHLRWNECGPAQEGQMTSRRLRFKRIQAVAFSFLGMSQHRLFVVVLFCLFCFVLVLSCKQCLFCWDTSYQLGPDEKLFDVLPEDYQRILHQRKPYPPQDVLFRVMCMFNKVDVVLLS